jgi:hypothetical protein
MEVVNRYDHESYDGAFLAACDGKHRSNLEEPRSVIEPKVIFPKRQIGLTAISLGILMTLLAGQAYPQNIRSKEEIASTLAIENLSIRDGVVSGEVRNKKQHELRDVQLLIRYTWLWDDERNPGKTDPGTSVYYTLKQTIAPGEKVSFSYKPSPPLPRIAGGRFESSVTIAGFTEVIQQPQR